jgi:hypothetical protein
MDDQPSLGQFIWLVRRELQWAHELDHDQPLRFDVESVALDLVVQADRTVKGGGGLDLKVMGVGLSGHGGVDSSHGSGNTVHVVLTARDTGGGRWEVGAADLEPPVRRAEAIPDLDDSARALPGAGDMEPPPRQPTTDQ